jgi:trimethylamine--corrinoid protein Co-methyltransferase
LEGYYMALKAKLEVISKQDYNRIHEASLKVLKETGIVFHNEEALQIFKKHGAKIEGKTAYFSKSMVEKALGSCPDKYTFQARDDARSVTVGEGFLLATNAGPIYVQDLDDGRRLGKLEDFAKIQKFYQASDVVSIVGYTPVDPSDIAPEERHLHIMYEILKNTNKPLFGYVCEGYKTRAMLDMVEIAFGNKKIVEEAVVIGVSINPISPLSYGDDAVETLIEYAKRGQSVLIAPAPSTGVTGPINLLGTSLLQNIEVLAGIVLVQLIKPGCPVVYLPAASAAYMKNASFVTGSPEMMLMNIACIQMASDFYGLPTRLMSGCTDSRVLDCQAGYETMQNLLLALFSGVHIFHESLGVLDSIMTTSYEKMVIDEELFKRLIRISEGITLSDEALSVDVIQEVGHKGNYLEHETTFNHFRERWLPTVSDWDSYEDWEKAGSEDVVRRANKRFKKIMQNAPDSLIDLEVERELKAYMENARKKGA